MKLMAKEGEREVFERHRRVGEAMRSGLERLGLDLLAERTHASNTVTAFRIPEGCRADVLRRRLREEHGIVVGGGQGLLKGKVLRIGHMGFVDLTSVARVVLAVEQILGGSS